MTTEKDCSPSDARTIGVGLSLKPAAESTETRPELTSVADLIDASDALYRRWQRANEDANEARDEANYIHRQWVMAKSCEQAAMRAVSL